MRFALIQIGLGAALVTLASLVNPWGWALLWPGWSVLIVGVAYLRVGGLGPGVFGKRPDGRLRWANVALLLPYFAVAWTLWQIKSRLGSENAYDEVAPGILVGRRPLEPSEAPRDMELVVDLTSEFPRSPSTAHVAGYECIPTLDTTAPNDADFAALVGRLEGQDGPIFVHCAMGHGRSATVAAALMIRRGLVADVEAAIVAMRERRPRIHLHRTQREAVARLVEAAGQPEPKKVTSLRG